MVDDLFYRVAIR